MVDVEAVDGPLDARRLEWIADLYGPVDPKYRDTAFLEHLFVRGPAGPALHAFAHADGMPVAHAAVVPGPARRGNDALRAGKLEALVVAKPYRGRRSGDASVVERLLDDLYSHVDERGFDVLHAFVLPFVGRVIRFEPLRIGPPSLVSLLRTPERSRRVVASLQGVARTAASVVVRARPAVRSLTADDADLLATRITPGHWGVVADGAIEWYASSPVVRVLEVGDARLLVQLPHAPAEPLRIAAWDGEGGALTALAGAVRVAGERGATSVRVQQHAGPSLRRAARLLGFVARSDLTTLWVRTRDPSLARAEAVVPTPMLYLGF